MVKEITLGLVASLLIILFWQGINVLPVVFLGFLAFFLWKIMGQNLTKNITTSSNSDKKIPEVDFDEIGGQKTAKKELIESLSFIKEVKKIKKMGIRPIKGLLLSGPPGTGKTMLAKAAARYTDSVFIGTSGSEFIEMYAGVGAKRIRKLFKNARNDAKKNNKNSAIVFIDEIDILGGKRGKVTSHLEYDQTLNQLLTEMDGISIDDRIQLLVMATTNRKDILDPALLRPGRFDRIIKVDLPAQHGRLNILKIHTDNKPLHENVDLEEIARQTFRFSGAHLESLANEAAILALRDNSLEIHNSHFMEAIDKIIMGEKIDKRPSDKELKRIAIHETGHALISEILSPNSVSTITITSRSNALGYVRHNPEEDHYLMTEKQLKEQICISIAGAVAEEVLMNSRSTGATNDFEKAIKRVKTMVSSGMTGLGVVKLDSVPQNLLHEEMSEILDKYENKVKKYIQDNKEVITEIANKLIEKETYSGDKLRELLNDSNVKVERKEKEKEKEETVIAK